MTHSSSMEGRARSSVRDAWISARQRREKQVKELEELAKPITELVERIGKIPGVNVTSSELERDGTVSFCRLEGSFTVDNRNTYNFSVAMKSCGTPDYRIGRVSPDMSEGGGCANSNLRDFTANIVDRISDEIGTYEWDVKEAEEKAAQVGRVADQFLAEQNLLQSLQPAPAPDVTP